MPFPEFQSEFSHSKTANCTSDLPFMHDEFVELVWDNGPTVMQGHSNRPRKSSFHSSFSSHGSKAQEKDTITKDAVFPKITHFRAIEPKISHFYPSGPVADIGVNAQDDDMVPWISYPIEDSLHNDYSSVFLNDYPGVDLNSINSQSSSVPSVRSNCLGQGVKNLHNVDQVHGSDNGRIRTNQLSHPPPEFHSSIPITKLRAADTSVCTQSKANQDGSNGGIVNFTHFSRPVALARANLQSVDRSETKKKATTATSSNPVESTLIDSSSASKSVLGTHGQLVSVPSKGKMGLFPKSPKETEAVCQEDTSKKNSDCDATNNCSRSPDQITSSSFAASVALGRHGPEKGHEPVVASSSVCSGGSAGATSNDHKHRKKRKHCEVEESGYQSEDLEDDSLGLKKPSMVQRTNSKRTRAAEVHNLSERRRRDRINEKMRALQELIPNCNKTDKASMLDEAIEYLKTLQMQVQIMSMGSGLCAPPMMMQHIRTPTVSHFAPMGLGMGMGIGLGYGMPMYDMNGSPSCPLMPVHPIHGPQFPCSSVPGTPVIHRVPSSTGLQMFGIPGQGFPVPIHHRPPFGSLSGATSAPVAVSSSRDQQQENVKFDKVKRPSVDDSQIHTSSQASEKGYEDSALVQ